MATSDSDNNKGNNGSGIACSMLQGQREEVPQLRLHGRQIACSVDFRASFPCCCCPCCCCCCYCPFWCFYCCCCWLLLLLFALRGVKMFVCINLQQTLMRLSMWLRRIRVSSRLTPNGFHQLAVPTPLLAVCATPPHTHSFEWRLKNTAPNWPQNWRRLGEKFSPLCKACEK